MRLRKIISGGQTGVDRAGLDAALALGIEIGGWCPKGRRAEDGAIPDIYPLRETKADDYPERTRLNVRDSDGTLILNVGPLDGGTKRTYELALELRKPCSLVDLDEEPNVGKFKTWLEQHNVGILNVAGPRESKRPGLQARATAFLRKLFAEVVTRAGH